MDTLKERLEYFLDYYNITAYQVSVETGIAESTFAHIRSGHTKRMRKITAERIAKYFIVSPTWFVTGRGEMLPRPPKNDDIDTKPPNTVSEEINALKNDVAVLKGQMEVIISLLNKGDPPKKHDAGCLEQAV